MKKILVVGAGPVGLTVAAELARHGISCRIIEKAPEASRFCRAIGVSARTLEIWDDMGILRKAIDAGLWIKGRMTDIPGQPLRKNEVDYSGLSFASLALPQYDTERILTERLSELGIRIERGLTVTGFNFEQDQIKVSINSDLGVVSNEIFDYMIGCDGAHSIVRRLAGIDFQGEMLPYEFMLADVKIDWELPRGFSYNALHPATAGAPDFFLAVPLPDEKRYRISTLSTEPFAPGETGSDHGIQSERPAPGLEGFQQIADRLMRIPARLSDIRWSSIFRISMRLAGKYQNGNVMIAGDAAHIHPPTGGQGMNTGIQDAFNLAWKLALVCKGVAKKKLLDSYEAERQEEGMNVINRTVTATMKFSQGGLQPDRMADAQMLVSYRKSTWVQNDPDVDSACALLAGDRAPDCPGLQQYGIGFRFRLFDLLKGTDHILIVDAQSEMQEVVAGLQDRLTSLKNKYGEIFSSLFRIVIVGHEAESITPPTGITWIQDEEKAFSYVYHSRNGSAFIIRPDGYIGWRGDSWKSKGIENYLANIFE